LNHLEQVSRNVKPINLFVKTVFWGVTYLCRLTSVRSARLRHPDSSSLEPKWHEFENPPVRFFQEQHQRKAHTIPKVRFSILYSKSHLMKSIGVRHCECYISNSRIGIVSRRILVDNDLQSILRRLSTTSKSPWKDAWEYQRLYNEVCGTHNESPGLANVSIYRGGDRPADR